MSDIKLFRYGQNDAAELSGKAVLVEKQLQTLIEAQMETFLGVRFLATEYSTGKTHKGRIDSLGLDENGCPVIIEYKRHTNENVINQGLYYLDWLLDHQAEFRWLVMEKLGKEFADKIEWSGTRLLCIAADFTKYDGHAVAQINRSIELIRYKLFDSDLLLLELVNAVSVEEIVPVSTNNGSSHVKTEGKTHANQIASASPDLLDLFEQIKSFILAQGDDVQEKPLKLYTAFKRLRNFVCATVIPKQDPHIHLWLKLDPDSLTLEEGFSRDVRSIGHWGTGDVEVVVRTPTDFEKARPLIERSYQEN